jgi:tol-pal system protein YbgF
MHIRSILIAGVVATLPQLTGCAGARYAETQQEMVRLQTRVEELERMNGRNRVVLEEMEERVLLLQDRVDAARLALQRRDSQTSGTGSRTVASVGGTPEAYRPMPSASAPPPFPEVDPLSVPTNLPVQRLGPPAGTAAAAVTAPMPPLPEEEPVEEVVVTMETLAARYGSEAQYMNPRPDSEPRRSPVRADGGPYAPIDTEGYSLPVVPMGQTPSTNMEVAAAGGVGTSSGSPLSYYRSALDLFNAGNYTESLASLDAFVATAPEADYMDNALFWMGECHYGLGDYSQALTYFQRVVSEYPDGNKVADSLLKVALSHERLEQPDQAIEVLSVLVETYPSTDAARRATERLRALR